MAREFPVHSHNMYPGCPASVPWEFVASHERQARINYDQTLERLAERGGLDPLELRCVLEDKPFPRKASQEEIKRLMLEAVVWLKELAERTVRHDRRYSDAEPFLRAVASFIHPVVTQEVKEGLPWEVLEKMFLEHLRRHSAKRGLCALRLIDSEKGRESMIGWLVATPDGQHARIRAIDHGTIDGSHRVTVFMEPGEAGKPQDRTFDAEELRLLE